jgi:hypothetical protein
MGELRKFPPSNVYTPEIEAQAAVPYVPARAAWDEVVVTRVCGTTTSVTDWGGMPPDSPVPQPITVTRATKRQCWDVKTTVHHPATPAQEAKAAVEYQAPSVKQDFHVGWNAGAHSIEYLPGSGYAEFKISGIGVVVGFSVNPEGTRWTDIEHAFYATRRVLKVVELGAVVFEAGNFDPADTLRIERVGARVEYFKNGVKLYRSARPSAGSVYLDASLYSANDSVSGALLMVTNAGTGSFNGAMLPPAGLLSDRPYAIFRAAMAAPRGRLSCVRSRLGGAMRPATSLWADRPYARFGGTMRPASGRLATGLPAPEYALFLGRAYPPMGMLRVLSGGLLSINSKMRPAAGLWADRPYAAFGGAMFPALGRLYAGSPELNAVLGGGFSAFGPLVGVLDGGFAPYAVCVLPAQPMRAELGGSFSPYAEITLGTVALRGILGGSIAPQGDVVLPAQPLVGLLGGRIGPQGLNELWVMNTEGGGTTQYEHYPFNSFAKIGNRYYGAGDDGLYLLEGPDDAGQPIAASFGLGQLDFGSPQLKTVTYCYLGTAAGAMRLEVQALLNGCPSTYRYPARGHGRSMREVRFDLGRGLRSSYVMPTFYNCNGSPFEVDAVRFLVAESARRI